MGISCSLQGRNILISSKLICGMQKTGELSMSEMLLLSVSIYLINSILSGIYTLSFLKEKYRKEAVLAVWSSACFLIQIVVFETQDRRFPVGEAAGIVFHICFLMFMQFLFFERNMQKQFFVVFSFVAGKETVKYIVSVFNFMFYGLCSHILDYFIAGGIINTLEKTHIWVNIITLTLCPAVVCLSLFDKQNVSKKRLPVTDI